MSPSSVQRIARNAGIQSAAETVSKVAALVLYAVLARELGTEGFGVFSYAFSLGTLLIVLAAPGVSDIVTRELARDATRLPTLFWNAITLRAAFGVPAVGLAVLVALAGDASGDAVLAVLLLGAALLAEALTKSVTAIFIAFEDLRPVALSLLVQRLATAFGGIAAALLGADVVVIGAVFVAAAVLGLGYAVWRLARSPGIPPVSVSLPDSRSLFVVALPIGITGILYAVLFRVDTVILAWFEPESVVGLYGATYRLVDATLFLSYSLGTVMFPVLSRLGRDGVGEAFTSSTKVLTVLLFPLGAGCVLFAEPVLRLVFGADYVGGATALRLLGVTIALYGISYMGSTTLIAQDRQRAIPWVAGGGALANIGLNVALIPVLSLDGAALATALTEVGRTAVLVALVAQVAGGVRLERLLAGPVAGCLAMTAVWSLLGEALWVIPVAGVAYLGALVVYERLNHPGDVRLVVDTLTRRRAPVPG